MQISVNDPQFETLLFTLLLFATILITLKKKPKDEGIFPVSTTQQLKGFAILTILFGHIGYFLSKDTQFLYPLSVASGMGVNLFLFLSGFGLTVSQIKKPLGIFEFYKKRLVRLFVPMWIVITLLLLAYSFFLGINYPQALIIKNYLGIFPEADLFKSLNSVLWYFTPILFYYLIFPFLTRKWILPISFVLIYYASIYAFKIPNPIGEDVRDIYRLHISAFPLGVLSALIPTYFPKNRYYRGILNTVSNIYKKRNRWLNYVLILGLCYAFSYYAIHSGVGEDVKLEQKISILTMMISVAVFILLPFSSSLIGTLGLYSYEIYLIHWPLLYHFDFLYKYFPPFIATYLYLFLFLGLSILLQKGVNKLLKKTSF